MKEELLVALRNALERGATLEQAAQSLTGAGYGTAEVQEASQFLSQGTASPTASPPTVKKVVPSTLQPAPPAQPPSPPVSPVIPVQPLPRASPFPTGTSVPEQPKSKKMLIILGTIVVVLLILLVLTIVFGQTLLDTFFKP